MSDSSSGSGSRQDMDDSSSGRLLHVDRAVKRYRRGPEVVEAVADVSLSLAEGELVALVGPSGSGKTTLLNLLAGWEEPDDGTVVWDDLPTSVAGGLSWTDVAMLPQRHGLAEELTVAQNVALPLVLAGRDAELDGVDALLAELGLAAFADRTPSETSLGEQQRTALARALSARPRLLLTDEPTGHQDEAWVEVVLALLRRACAAGTTVVMATHDTDLLESADRVLRMSDGRLADDPVV